MSEEITKPLMSDKTGRQLAQALENILVEVPVVDNLTTNDPDKALSAKQGKVIADTYVRHTNNVVAGSVPINANQLNGHPDTYFATASAVASLNDTSTISATSTTYGTVAQIHGGKFGRLVLFTTKIEITANYTVGASNSIGKINESSLLPSSTVECLSVVIQNRGNGDFTNLYAGYCELASDGNIYQKWTSNAAGYNVLATFAYWL